jgi:hypothetical protein
MHPIFKFREKETQGILDLLNAVTLGTNGAHYRHLDTNERILEADHPLFLSMERNGTTLGNVTFCRRERNWYIRYFAFSNALQSSGKSASKSGMKNRLKQEIERFFETGLNGKSEWGEIDSFYAYIDPKNEKSLWMSASFGFKTIGHVATQTYSRVKPKHSERLQKIQAWDEVAPIINATFQSYRHFATAQTKKPPFYLLRNPEGEIVAAAKTSISRWEIHRFPGKLGGVLTKIIPFIPRLNQIVNPKEHAFVVPEAVYIKDNDPELLNELFEGILHQESKNLILWWVDEQAPLYIQVKSKMNWGLLHKIIGVHKVNIVERSRLENDSSTPFYTSGFDFI